MSEYWERELDPPQGIRVHRCACCGVDIYVGDEVYQIDDGKWYCTGCCALYEVEMPERDWDFERKARQEVDNGYF